MQPASRLTPCQRLQQAWLEYHAVTTLEDQNQKQNEMINLLKEEILGFSRSDADFLKELSKAVRQSPNIDQNLITRIVELADRLTEPSLELPTEIMMQGLSFVPPLRRNGLNRSCKMWAEEATKMRPSLVNEPNDLIPLDRLLLLLVHCCGSVEHLDVSQLLTETDRKKLSYAQLEKMVRLCPNLKSLTLLEMDQILGKQLCSIVHLAPHLIHLNVAGCVGVVEDNLHELRASRPRLAIGFIPYVQKDYLSDLLRNGVRLRDYFALDNELKTYITRNLEAIGVLARSGFPFELFCRISWQKRELFLAISDSMHRFKTLPGFSFQALAELSPNEITLIYGHLHVMTDICHAGFNFIKFCGAPLETKQMLLKRRSLNT